MENKKHIEIRGKKPVSPNSPKILMKTSASVPLPLMSAVKTLTMYLLSGRINDGK